MISIIITSANEAGIIARAIDAVLNQKIKEEYELIIAAPDIETKKLVLEYKKKFTQIKYFKDKGVGKANALNDLFKSKIAKGRILVLTDGDVYVGEDSINSLLEEFRDEGVGCVSGRPVALNDKSTMTGYFSHLLLDAGAHKIREKLSNKNKFLECSGYLFAFRNNLIERIPVDVAEDSIIPYLLWKKGYKIKYAGNAKVYVKYPENLENFVRQRKRAGVGSHSKLKRHHKDFPRVKTFKNEVIKGLPAALRYPKNLKELYWTCLLFFIRFYIWFIYYFEAIFRKREYTDKWERIESTKNA